MYLPRHFAQEDPAALAALVRAHPLALLVHADADGPTADPLPLQLVESADAGAGTTAGWRLQGHVARANPLCKRADGKPVLAVFTGGQAYVTPNAYPSKAATHRVVPTWNYCIVQAHGTLRAIDDAPWLHALVSRLTDTHESAQPHPWAVTDAPEDYRAQMLRAIVGIEIAVTRVVGKWKVSQNRDRADHDGVQALHAAGNDDARVLAAVMAGQRHGRSDRHAADNDATTPLPRTR